MRAESHQRQTQQSGGVYNMALHRVKTFADTQETTVCMSIQKPASWKDTDQTQTEACKLSNAIVKLQGKVNLEAMGTAPLQMHLHTGFIET